MHSRHFMNEEEDFRVGTRIQKAWDVHIATAFFFGEAGAGLYFVSQFFDFTLGMSIALLMVLIGKGGGHLVHLGQPLRGWRALAKVGSSWISRGLLAIAVFVGAGALHVLNLNSAFLPQALSTLISLVAVVSCLVIMVYQGFAMSHSSAITLWSTGLMPVTSLTYGLLNGVLLTLVLGYNTPLLVDHPEIFQLLQAAAIALMLYGVVMVLSLLHGAKYGSEGGQKSVELLLRGAFAGWFIPVVILLGFVVSALFMSFAPRSLFSMIAVAGTELTGYYAFRILMFKVGTYDPVMTFAHHFKR